MKEVQSETELRTITFQSLKLKYISIRKLHVSSPQSTRCYM